MGEISTFFLSFQQQVSTSFSNQCPRFAHILLYAFNGMWFNAYQLRAARLFYITKFGIYETTLSAQVV
jgi:hypothetical protein